MSLRGKATKRDFSTISLGCSTGDSADGGFVERGDLFAHGKYSFLIMPELAIRIIKPYRRDQGGQGLSVVTLHHSAALGAKLPSDLLILLACYVSLGINDYYFFIAD